MRLLIIFTHGHPVPAPITIHLTYFFPFHQCQDELDMENYIIKNSVHIHIGKFNVSILVDKNQYIKTSSFFELTFYPSIREVKRDTSVSASAN